MFNSECLLATVKHGGVYVIVDAAFQSVGLEILSKLMEYEHRNSAIRF